MTRRMKLELSVVSDPRGQKEPETDRLRQRTPPFGNSANIGVKE